MLNNVIELYKLSVILFFLTFTIGNCQSTEYVNEYLVQIPAGYSHAKSLAVQMGMVLHHKVKGFEDYYVFKVDTRKRPIGEQKHRKARLKRSVGVVFIEQQKSLKRVKRWFLPKSPELVFNDPLYKDQWYINRGFYEPGKPDMNILEAWKMGYSGKGVVVSVLDDGIDYTHPDLSKNYDPEASYDLNGNDNDPMPNVQSGTNNHGTQCGGEISAQANNNNCGVGVAFNSRLGGLRMLDGTITDRVEGESLSFKQQHIDIYSGSWGPDDNGQTLEGPGRLAQAGFERGVKFGRRGLGNIYVWASGNGGPRDSCAADGYTSSIYTIAISSAGEYGDKTWFQERCSALMAVAYTGSKNQRNIVTTFPGNKCVKTFTGTSASAPLAAGIIALLLEANPDLTWRDVQHLTVLTSDLSSLKGPIFVNGANRKFSPDFGYGVLNAGKMVKLGLLWHRSPEQHLCTTPYKLVKQSLMNKFNKSATISVTNCGPNNIINYVEHVVIRIKIEYAERGALRIHLISPSGTRSEILPYRDRDKKSGVAYLDKWPLMSVHFWGEKIQGEWRLEIDNLESSPLLSNNKIKGWLNSFKLEFYGTEQFPIHLKQPNFQPGENNEWFRQFEQFVYANKPSYLINSADSLFSTTSALQIVNYIGTSNVIQCHAECLNNSCSASTQKYCYSNQCRHLTTYNNICVETCPPGTFNSSSNICQKCHESCAKCNGSSVRDCITCRPRDVLINGQCGISKNCSLGHYKEGSKCLPCSAACTTCLSATLCLSCRQPNYVLSHTYHCQSSCDLGTYPTLSNQCQVCHPSCLGCASAAQHHCTECISREFLLPSYSSHLVTAQSPSTYLGKCVIKCPFGFFINKTKSICYECHPSCKTCSDMYENSCLSCLLPLYYDKITGKCIDPSVGNCLPNEYKATNGKCVKCPGECSTCSSKSCTRCKNDFPWQFPGGHCKSKCPIGYFPSSNPYQICLPCIDYCPPIVALHDPAILPNCTKFCTGYLANRAISPSNTSSSSVVVKSRFQNTNQPVPCTALHTYYNNQTHQCNSCHVTCARCYGNRLDQCLSCVDPIATKRYNNHSILYKGRCYDNCPSNHYSTIMLFNQSLPQQQRFCVPCHQSCLDQLCDAESGKCKACPQGHKLSRTNGLCERIVTCTINRFWNVDKAQCIQCDKPCRSCLANPSQCNSCHRGTCLKSHQGKCLPCCNNEVTMATTNSTICGICQWDKELCQLDLSNENDADGVIIHYRITTISLIGLGMTIIFFVLFWLVWTDIWRKLNCSIFRFFKSNIHHLESNNSNVVSGKQLFVDPSISVQYKPLLRNGHTQLRNMTNIEGSDEEDEYDYDDYDDDDDNVENVMIFKSNSNQRLTQKKFLSNGKTYRNRNRNS